MPKNELPDKKQAFIEARSIFAVFAVLVYLLAVEMLFPIRAAYYALIVMIVLSILDKYIKVSFDKFIAFLETATSFTIKVIPLASAAGIIMASITLTGTGVRMASRLIDLAGGSLFLLVILTAIICYILGLGISAMLAYIILSSFVAPALMEFGVPTIVSHFFIIYAGLFGFFTPPYAVVALQASSLSGGDFYKVCWQSMKFAIVAYLIPVAIVLDPVLLLEDASIGRFIFRILISVIAIYLFAGGAEGYFENRNLSMIERILLSIGAILLFLPGTPFLISGGIISAFSIILIYLNTKRMKTASDSN